MELKVQMQQIFKLGRALRLVWQSEPRLALASGLLLVVQGTLPLLSLYIMKLAIDAVNASLSAPNRQAAFSQVAWFIGLLGAVALVAALCRSFSRLVREAQTEVVIDHIHELMHAKSIEMDLEYYENSQYYDTFHRAQEQASFRPITIVNGLIQVGQNGISLLVIVVWLFSFHWGIAVILLSAALPGVFVRLKYADTFFRWQRQSTPSERQAKYLKYLLTEDAHAKEIRLFGLGKLFSKRFRHLRRQIRRERLTLATRRALSELVPETSAALALFASFAFIAYRTVQGMLTLGDLVMYYQAFQRGQDFLSNLLNSLVSLYEDNLFLSNLYEFLDLKRTVLEPLHPQAVPNPMQTGIAFNHVSFRYPTGTRTVLEDITLTIQPSEVVALVGENGSGKTTLVKLLCRLYDPSEGNITFDGIDLRQLETTALRRQISVIFQDYAKYHLTAQENIWIGNIDLPPESETIAAAARRSGVHDAISQLPQGYDTVLGKWFEEGEELSIGQWQKVALARAFLRDSQIIVLDEPTSAMDPKAEAEVFEKFRQLLQGQAAILISHRLSTVKMADRIYVLEKGRIIESGSHKELMQIGGTYARLFETQAQNYR
jgi:ATP-binding cassette subfamily B protein